MRKVHILTFHNALNYGAVLQCVALYKTIELFAECDVVDYRSPQIEQVYATFSTKRSLKQNVRGILLASKTRNKRGKFLDFMKMHIKLTEPFFDIKELQVHNWEQEDVFCVGSDQVWNRDLTNDDLSYFFAFIKQGTRKISYAASVGNELSVSEILYMKKRLHDFQAISIREKSAYEKLTKAGIKCQQNIDPVYLLSKFQWENMSNEVPKENKAYVLVFLLQKSNEFVKKAYDYAVEKGKRLVVITAIELHKLHDVEYIETCGPQEFLRYFMKADVIFTNSFHGISMSIIFNKVFYFEYLASRFKTNSRIKDIITLFGLESQNASLYKLIPDTGDIDYISINKVIEIEQEKAKKYLMESICK